MKGTNTQDWKFFAAGKNFVVCFFPKCTCFLLLFILRLTKGFIYHKFKQRKFYYISKSKDVLSFLFNQCNASNCCSFLAVFCGVYRSYCFSLLNKNGVLETFLRQLKIREDLYQKKQNTKHQKFFITVTHFLSCLYLNLNFYTAPCAVA